MIKNYFKTAVRNIFRNKAITLINLFGLSVALVAFIFITVWVQNELSFDSYHNGAKDIYLVGQKEAGSEESGVITPFPFADVLNRNSSTENTARLGWWGGVLNVHGQLFTQETKAAAVDSNWFKIFSYKVLSGDINAFNRNPFSLIFTRSKAKQLFGNSNPIGQVVKLDTTLYQVRAIIEDNPINSSLQFEMLAPMAARLAYRKSASSDWNNASYRTFIKISPNANTAAFIRNTSALLQEASGQKNLTITLQPLNELHFDTKSNDSVFRRGSHTAVFVFSVLALLLLITASINYVNLSIAKANSRSKEISIRKIIGGTRIHLFFQFLIESFLLCLLALLISFVIMIIALPAFNQLTETDFQLSVSSKILWIVLLGTLLFTTLLNGVFPALTLSLFKPLNYLQGHSILKTKNLSLRKGLMVFQFVIGIVFIIGTIVIFQQMKLAQTSAAQYSRDQVVSFALPASSFQKMSGDEQRINSFCQTLKHELLSSSSIQGVALGSNSIEGRMNTRDPQSWYWLGRDTSLRTTVSHLTAEPDTKNIFNLQLKQGRWFTDDNFDQKNFVLNETAVKELGISQPVIGQLFAKERGDTGQIIGVIRDFNFNSLYNKIEPLIIAQNDDLKTTFFVKIAPGKIPQAMNAIEVTWKKNIPDAPFDYQFMNQAFDNLYKDDLKISKLVLLFSSISITISVLGLFGLAAFVAEQRRKEIGIRKVLGASAPGIAILLSKDFIKLVVIAIVIASPLAWWGMNKWLEEFAYRISISWWIFALSGIAAILIALVTVSSQAIKTAMANPVKSLRAE